MAYKRTRSILLILLLGITTGDTAEFYAEYFGCYDWSSFDKYNCSTPLNCYKAGFVINHEQCTLTCWPGSFGDFGINSRDKLCYCGGDTASGLLKEDSTCNITCTEIKNVTNACNKESSLYDIRTNEPKPDFNDSVAFLVGSDSQLRVYNSTTLPQYDTIMKTSTLGVESVDYHYKRNLVFANTGQNIVMMHVSPTFDSAITPPTVLKRLYEYRQLGYGLAVDWVADKIYWVDIDSREGDQYIFKMNLDGTNSERVFHLGSYSSVRLTRIEVDPYSRLLFWLADDNIMSLNLTSNEYHNNINEKGIWTKDFCLDRSAQKVYYIGKVEQNTSLYSVDYSGSDQAKIFSVPQMDLAFYGMAVHEGFIYWVNHDHYNNGLLQPKNIYRASLHSEGDNTVQYVLTSNPVIQYVNHMRIVHPDIQKPPTASHAPTKDGVTSSI